ncbi:MAG: transglutaminase-like domain-containing protein [Pirellulales bacterium]
MLPAFCHPRAYEAFAAELARLEQPGALFRAAVSLAMHELPQTDLAACEAATGALAGTVRSRLRSESPSARLAHLHDVLFDQQGFRGNVDDYYNPRNSYLPVVLETKRGIPISLSLIYIEVARRIGLRAEGINSPGHFLVRVDTESGAMLVDAFYEGRALSREEAMRRIGEATGVPAESFSVTLEPASPRQWLARMLNNLQAIFAQRGQERELAAMQELQALLARE